MEEVNNEQGVHEEKMEGKSLRKPRNAPKASASEAGMPEAGTPKAKAPRTPRASKTSETPKAPKTPKVSETPIASEAPVNEIIDIPDIRKEQVEEIENTVKDVTDGETKKKGAGKRKLCKLVKKDFLKKHFKEYEELVQNPMYICGKCGRAAKDAKSLCKPTLIG